MRPQLNRIWISCFFPCLCAVVGSHLPRFFTAPLLHERHAKTLLSLSFCPDGVIAAVVLHCRKECSHNGGLRLTEKGGMAEWEMDPSRGGFWDTLQLSFDFTRSRNSCSRMLKVYKCAVISLSYYLSNRKCILKIYKCLLTSACMRGKIRWWSALNRNSTCCAKCLGALTFPPKLPHDGSIFFGVIWSPIFIFGIVTMSYSIICEEENNLCQQVF